MLSNYLKVALRTFKKYKSYTSINVLGLTISLACGLLMLLWVQDEHQQEKCFADSDRIYRLWRTIPNNDGELETRNSTPYPTADALQKDFAEVADAVAYRPHGSILLKRGGEELIAKGAMGHFSMLDLFSIPLLSGTLEGADEQLEGIFISRALALRYFGETWSELALNETIPVDGRDVGQADLKILGVYEDLPKETELDFELLTNVRRFAKINSRWTGWGSNAFLTFVKLEDKASIELLRPKIASIVKDNGVSKDLAVYMQSMGDTYLWSKFENGVPVGGRITYVRIFFFAALFLLLMACINFVNLATVQATRRAGEVGVRKVMGAGRSSLFVQFMMEAGLITLVSVVLAVLLCEGSMPYVNELLGKEMAVDLGNLKFWGVLVLIIATITLLAGAYPSFALAAFPIASVLKNRLGGNMNNHSLRKSLVVFQFVLSALLLSSSLIISRQVNFIKNNQLGIDRDHVIQLNLSNEVKEKVPSLKAALLNSPSITAVSQVMDAPINIGRATDDFSWPGKDPQQEIRMQYLTADKDFTKVYQMDMAAGQFFQREIPDTLVDRIVINETAAALMGLDDPVGAVINIDEDPITIAGVVKDFHSNSIHQAIQPLVIFHVPEDAEELAIRYQPGNVEDAISHIETSYQQFAPNSTAQFGFLDLQYERMYRSELLIGKLANFFAFIAILISCLGLLGLIGFIVEQKTKEIGIRKVLGASVVSIVGMLSRDLIQLVLIAFLIAIPITWYFMQDWLGNFEYKVDIDWWVFALAGMAAVGVAFITMCLRSVRAATVNPVDALRSE